MVTRKQTKSGTKARKAAPRNKSGKKKPGTPYADIRADLEKQKTTFLTEVGLVVESGLHSNQEELSDTGDQASAVANQNFILRLKEREQKLLKKIEEALDRIDRGTYGICEECGERIGLKRLKARPVTTLCIECKTEQENEEKSRL